MWSVRVMTERMFWFNEDNIKRVGFQYGKSGKKAVIFCRKRQRRY
jgi:hypothetical protein